MTKLSDTQARILTDASRHPALLASAARLPTAVRQSVFRSMLKNLLLAEVPVPAEHGELAWRQEDDGGWMALHITREGLRAIGKETVEPTIELSEMTEAEVEVEVEHVRKPPREASDVEGEAGVARVETTPVAAAVQPRQGLRAAAAASVAASPAAKTTGGLVSRRPCSDAGSWVRCWWRLGSTASLAAPTRCRSYWKMASRSGPRTCRGRMT